MENVVYYAFEDATFAPREGRLRLRDEDVVLEQKVADLLHAFCRRPGQVLTKTWLMEEIWPDRVVNEDSLSVAVSKLRRALGDRASAPKYIRTVTGTGYLWLPEVRRVEVEEKRAAETTGAGSRPRLLAGLVAAGLLVAAVGGWWVSQDRVAAVPPPVDEMASDEVRRLLERAEERLDSDQPEELRQAIADFREILERDPDSAAAYLGIAKAKLELSALGGRLDIELYADEVHALLDRVLELEPDNAEAWLRKGELYMLANWEMGLAEQAFLRAIESEPGDPISYLAYSEFLITLGEFERAEEVLQRLREANPAWYQFVNMSYVYYMRGELERALAEVRRLVASEPESDYHHRMLHRIALVLGDDELAFEQLLILMRKAGINEERIGEYTALYRQEGIARLFGRFLADRLEANIGHYVPPISWARYAVVAGQHDAAFRWLEEAVAERQPQVLLLIVDPIYLPLRNDPRFKAIRDRLPQRAGDLAVTR